MTTKRVVGIDIPLTDEQKRLLKEVAGEDVNSLFIAIRTPITGEGAKYYTEKLEDRELVKALYEASSNLLPTLEMSSHNAPFEGILAAAVVW